MSDDLDFTLGPGTELPKIGNHEPNKIKDFEK